MIRGQVVCEKLVGILILQLVTHNSLIITFGLTTRNNTGCSIISLNQNTKGEVTRQLLLIRNQNTSDIVIAIAVYKDTFFHYTVIACDWDISFTVIPYNYFILVILSYLILVIFTYPYNIIYLILSYFILFYLIYLICLSYLFILSILSYLICLILLLYYFFKCFILSKQKYKK